MAAATSGKQGRGCFTVDLVGVAAHTGGDIANVLNPEGEDLIITKAVVYIGTQSTGAANLNAGIGTSAEHDKTDLVSALDAKSGTGVAYNGYASEGAKGAMVIWGAAQYLVVNASASTAGFVGKLHVEYIHA